MELMKRHLVLIVIILISFGMDRLAGQSVSGTSGDVVPKVEWQQVSPESVGYSSAKLEALRGWIKTQDTTSMVVVVQGRIFFLTAILLTPAKLHRFARAY
jgi:hypothetical protein